MYAMNTEKQSRVLDASRELFYRYGFARVTMSDIASAAGMSRPALYLVFPNKEDIFLRVLTDEAGRILEELRQTLPTLATAEEKLRYAFDRWIVQPYILMTQSPDASDLVDCTLDFVKETMDRLGAAFEAELVAIISPLAAKRSRTDLSPAQLAHILVSAAAGFKKVAANAEELQQLMWGQLAIVMAAMGVDTRCS
jgi:AcrR family transcriptional regulator